MYIKGEKLVISDVYAELMCGELVIDDQTTLIRKVGLLGMESNNLTNETGWGALSRLDETCSYYKAKEVEHLTLVNVNGWKVYENGELISLEDAGVK